LVISAPSTYDHYVRVGPISKTQAREVVKKLLGGRIERLKGEGKTFDAAHDDLAEAIPELMDMLLGNPSNS
jgi:hypothetical protein